MRLSTNVLYDTSTQSILRQQSKVSTLGQKLAAGRNLVTPADDPRAAAQALKVAHADAANDQFKANRTAARNHLGFEENALNTTVDALQAAKSRLVQAGNGTLSDADRKSVATALEGVRDQILGAANTRDGNGSYIFSGYASDQPAFGVSDDGKATYQGDQGIRQLAVEGSRKIAINDLGDYVFKSQADSGGSTNIIDALGDAISALSQGTSNEADATALQDTLSATQQHLDSSLDNVSDVLATVGARQNTLDSLDAVGDSRSLNYKTTLADLQGTNQEDVVKTISDYKLAQVALQFSQKTFTDTQKLSLFNLI